MNTFIRRVASPSSPEWRQIVTVSRTRFPLRLTPNAFSFTNRTLFSPPKFPNLTSFASKTLNSFKDDSIPPAMEPRPAEPSDLHHASGGEDFVHIESPKPDPEPLSESIVNVAEELAADSDGKKEHNSYDCCCPVSGEPEKKELPDELSRSVMVLTCKSSAAGGSCDVYLVGTAHVSQESCREVQAVVSYLKPEVVFLELCSSRIAVLTRQNIKVPTVGEMIKMCKKNANAFGILYSWFLAKVADKLEVFPGSEFRVAFEEARKYEGKVILGDRPVQITLRRTWSKMPLWHKIKLLYSLFFQAVFLPSSEDLNKMLKEMNDVDMLTLVIQEMSKEFPTLMETLVHERDQYMSATILRIASEHNSVVAVVGKGHLQGIRNYWQQPVVMKDLLEIPSHKPATSAIKILASLGVAVTGVAIVSGIFMRRK